MPSDPGNQERALSLELVLRSLTRGEMAMAGKVLSDRRPTAFSFLGGTVALGANSARRASNRRHQWHHCLGTLFAPSIIFFAFTGSLQLFGLHEGHPGEAYQSPAWVQKLGSIHKDQTVSEKHGPPPGFGREQGRPPESVQASRPQQPPQGNRPDAGRKSNKFTLALKWFFLATAVGLIFSTLLGIYMAFKFNRSRALVWGMLFLGTAIPLALIVMMA